jgi:hypothetical protein
MPTISNFCKVFVNSELEIDAFRNQISNKLKLVKTSSSFFETEFLDLSIKKNDEFDDYQMSQFPDGFLYFKFLLEFEFKDWISIDYCTEYVGKTLDWLWKTQMPAIAVCDYEERLPNNGGYNDKSLPWPI